jgi:hypothetical protein
MCGVGKPNTREKSDEILDHSELQFSELKHEKMKKINEKKNKIKKYINYQNEN